MLPDVTEDVMTAEPFENLTVHRSDTNAFEQRGGRNRHLDDRAGLWLVSIAGTSLLLLGAYLLSCAAARLRTGHWPTLGRRDADPFGADVVTVESVDSFPASDAPSSNATTASPRPMRGAD